MVYAPTAFAGKSTSSAARDTPAETEHFYVHPAGRKLVPSGRREVDVDGVAGRVKDSDVERAAAMALLRSGRPSL
jgi:hypothetical protein